MKVFCINRLAGDAHYIIAESPADVLAVVDEVHIDGSDDPEEFDRTDLVEVPDAKVLNIDLDDGAGPVRKSCAEWVAQQGRGLLASRNY